jgi:hypothetical protein
MARDKGHLTDLQVRHWIKAGKPLAKADGDGLTFTLSADGVAGWILRYRHGGRRRGLTIGRYPDIGLAEARGIATLKRAEVQQGRNPAAEKQKAKAIAARDWTVRHLAKDYRAKKLVSLAELRSGRRCVRPRRAPLLPRCFAASRGTERAARERRTGQGAFRCRGVRASLRALAAAALRGRLGATPPRRCCRAASGARGWLRQGPGLALGWDARLPRGRHGSSQRAGGGRTHGGRWHAAPYEHARAGAPPAAPEEPGGLLVKLRHQHQGRD